MKTVFLGVALILSSTSLVVEKSNVLREDAMTIVPEQTLITGNAMTNTAVFTPKKKSSCRDKGCWDSIIKKLPR